MVSPFEDYGPDDVRDLVAAYPLAWVMARNGEASLLPLIGVVADDGNLAELIGHFALSNPLRQALAADSRATVLFNGPQGYVSPSHAGRRDWGPTWNYAQIRIDAEITIDAALTAPALDLLIEHVESDKPEPWAAAELGDRYDRLIDRIVGFRARVVSVAGRFKLGQDEDLPTLRNILSNLPDPELVSWMRRFNRVRLSEADLSD